MWKWIVGLLVSGVALGVGYGVYDAYRAGLFSRPEMPEGAFSLSFENGLRAILVDVKDESETRHYLGTPMQVPFYLEESWSFCHPPVSEDFPGAMAIITRRNWPGERLDAVCKLTVDKEVVVMGLITSVPKT